MTEQIEILEAKNAGTAGTAELIVIKQFPEFEQSFIQANAEITKMLAGLKDLDFSEESKNEAKKIRADLNKKLTLYEERRKFIKCEINKPYAELERLYDGYIGNPIKDTLAEMDYKIAEIERRQIEKKTGDVLEYFAEYRDSLGADLEFLTFDRLKLCINLSITDKKLKEQIREKCDKIKADIECLKAMGELADRYIICYRNVLDTTQAISTVNEAVEEEQDFQAEKESHSAYLQAQKEAESKVGQVLAESEPEVTPAVEVVEPAEVYEVLFGAQGYIPNLKEFKKELLELGKKHKVEVFKHECSK